MKKFVMVQKLNLEIYNIFWLTDYNDKDNSISLLGSVPRVLLFVRNFAQLVLAPL